MSKSNSVFILLVILSSSYAKRSRKLEDQCSYSYDFTECDPEKGGRWRVVIPSPGCEGMTPQIQPKRLEECYKSCDAGQFLNLETVECEQCQPGTYSLGGGLRFDLWDPLPEGFKATSEKFHSVFSSFGHQFAGVNCSKWGWRPKGDVILSQGGPCVAILYFSAELVKPGSLKFTYQYSDDSVLFQFQANSDQCESLQDAGSTWPPLTGEGIWRTEEIRLRTGHNIFQWKTMGVDAHRPKPVLIKKIEIQGVGFSPSCLACPGGMWNSKAGARECSICPKDTYSQRNSTKCTACANNFYAEPGSSACKQRPTCSSKDYYQVNTPCNELNQTRLVYKWIEPKICIDPSGASKLPDPGPYQECPPCNPGTEYRDGQCIACEGNKFSDGLTKCSNCPKNTAADRNHRLTQWFSWPPEIHTTCISPEDNGCSPSPAWQLNGNYVRSGRGHTDWVYLVLTLTINGFRGIGGIINGQLIEVGRLMFTFDMKCLHDCELLLMQGTTSKNATVIQRWIGTQQNQVFRHTIYKNDSYSFSWAFQKVGWDSINSESSSGTEWNDPNDTTWNQEQAVDNDSVVKIYNINVTNTIDGGASSCIQCQDGLTYSTSPTYTDNSKGSCETCTPGHYRTTVSIPRIKNLTGTNVSTSAEAIVKCLPCARNEVTVGAFATECTACGPGLISKNGLTCTTDCFIKMGDYFYDLRPLKGFHNVKGSPLFTSSGTQYYHSYNISFCEDQDAQCYKNVSLPHGYDNQSTRVEALICQSTVFPPSVGMGGGTEFSDQREAKPLSTHAGSLGDHLLGISHSPSILGLSVAHVIQDSLDFPHQFHFFYSTTEPTPACSAGRSTTITFRCRIPANSWSGIHNDKSGSEDSEIKIPEKCPDATCDGCNYHFIWETPFACHLCSEDELTIVRGECKEGVQEIHYLNSLNSMCLLKQNSSWPTTLKCQTRLPYAVEISIQLAIGLTIVLTLLLICFWRKHRKLEYKYMKLVASGPSRNHDQSNSSHALAESQNHHERDMLPVAESCALDPDAEDDEEEEFFSADQRLREPHSSSQMKEVGFYSDGAIKSFVSKFSVLNRLKTSLVRRGAHETGNSLEIMNLTDKEALT